MNWVLINLLRTSIESFCQGLSTGGRRIKPRGTLILDDCVVSNLSYLLSGLAIQLLCCNPLARRFFPQLFHNVCGVFPTWCSAGQVKFGFFCCFFQAPWNIREGLPADSYRGWTPQLRFKEGFTIGLLGFGCLKSLKCMVWNFGDSPFTLPHDQLSHGVKYQKLVFLNGWAFWSQQPTCAKRPILRDWLGFGQLWIWKSAKLIC